MANIEWEVRKKYPALGMNISMWTQPGFLYRSEEYYLKYWEEHLEWEERNKNSEPV